MTDNTLVPRTIEKVWTVQPQRQGPRHTVGLVLEPGHWTAFDPFLLLAEDWFETGTFDVHPHRGIETVTYVIEGKLKHYDSKFGEGQLLPGDVQWMTAGRGVIHKEDPDADAPVHSLQLWVNLPRTDKMTEPRYQNLRRQDMPARKEDGVEVRVFSGSSGTVKADTLNHVPVTYVEITLEAGAELVQDLPGSYRGFLYVLEGRGFFGENRVEAGKGQAMWLADSEPDVPSGVLIHAEEPMRVLLIAGEPVREPVVAYGPFVMNTKAEIQQAIADYQAGRFQE